MDRVILDAGNLQSLFEVLMDQGYTIIGPTIQDGAIVFDEIYTIGDLPQGWTDVHDAGTYRLKAHDKPTYFSYTNSPCSWKKYLHPPAVRLLESVRTKEGFEMKSGQESVTPQYAFLGVRPCDLRAIGILDRVFLQGEYVDPIYQARRSNILIIAINCSQAGSTCFCTSVGGSPHAESGFDIALTELHTDTTHYFMAEIGSEIGQRTLDKIPHRFPTDGEIAAAQALIETTAMNMGRYVDTDDIKQVLYDNLEHPRWDHIATRCLACANCTMVCPTCFCNTVEDVTDLTGQKAERWRKWDSCFTSDFSYIHGGNVRQSSKARYRQWLTHKFATWQDQFGSLGCVGCGRCITWCPVGIDITEEITTIRSE